MTIRELINELLDKNMDSEVLLETYDHNREGISGVLFHIDSVTKSKRDPTIKFTDWRDVDELIMEKKKKEDAK